MPPTTKSLTLSQLVNHLSEVGPNVKPVRQSVGATILVNNSVQRRRAGLPLAAGLVNLLAGPRPEGMPGPQSAYIVQNFTFRSTRSTSPLQYGDAANMVDYRAALPPDRWVLQRGFEPWSLAPATWCSCGVVREPMMLFLRTHMLPHMLLKTIGVGRWVDLTALTARY